MADIYSNFVFGKTTALVDSSTTTIVVTSPSTWPTTDQLAYGDFYLTIESPLSSAPSFEIVKLTDFDPVTGTMTVLRGQDGTDPVSHANGTYVKAALTSAMLQRARSGDSGTSLPPSGANFNYLPGDTFLLKPANNVYVFTGTAWVLSGGGGGGGGGGSAPLNSYFEAISSTIASDQAGADPAFWALQSTPGGTPLQYLPTDSYALVYVRDTAANVSITGNDFTSAHVGPPDTQFLEAVTTEAGLFGVSATIIIDGLTPGDSFEFTPFAAGSGGSGRMITSGGVSGTGVCGAGVTYAVATAVLPVEYAPAGDPTLIGGQVTVHTASTTAYMAGLFYDIRRISPPFSTESLKPDAPADFALTWDGSSAIATWTDVSDCIDYFLLGSVGSYNVSVTLEQGQGQMIFNAATLGFTSSDTFFLLLSARNTHGLSPQLTIDGTISDGSGGGGVST